MRINSLRLNNFRLFRGEYEFNFLDKELIIIEGQNGHGKSTLFDAIEWCITGEFKRYKGSREPNKFNFLLNHQENLLEDAEMYVELVIRSKDNKDYRIKRSINKSQVKPKGETSLYINENEYSVKNGNKKISEILSKKIHLHGNDRIKDVTQYNINETELDAKNMIEFFSATQILSQDELSDFVLAKKPQDRFIILERILGLEKYGDAFRNFLKDEGQDKINKILAKIDNKRNILSGKIKSIEDELFKINTELTTIKNNYEINEGINEEEIISQIEEIIISQDDLKYDFLNQEIIINEQLKSKISDIRNKILKSLEEIQLKITILEKNKPVFNINKSDMFNRKNEYERLIYKINKKISIVSKALNKYKVYQSNFELFKNTRSFYTEEKRLFNEIIKNTNENNKKIENYFRNDLIKEVLNKFIDIGIFKSRFEQESKVQEALQKGLKIKIISNKIQEYEKDLNIAESRINELNVRIKSSEDKMIVHKNALKSINDLMENTQNDFVRQMIFDIQEFLCDNHNYSNCPVCGNKFGNNEILVQAIKQKMKHDQNLLSKQEKQTMDIQNEINKLLNEIEKIKQEYVLRVQEKEKYKNEIVTQNSNREMLKIGVSEKWLTLSSDELKTKIENSKKFLNDYKVHYSLVQFLAESLETKSDLNHQIDEKNKILNKLKNEAGGFTGLLECSESSIESKQLKLNNKISKFNTLSNELVNNQSQLYKNLSEVNEALFKRKLIVDEISVIAPLENETIQELEYIIGELSKQIQNDNNLNNRLELIQNKINTFLSHEEFVKLNTAKENFEKRLKKYIIIENEYNTSFTRYNSYLNQLDTIKTGSKQIQTRLMSKVIKKYSSLIDRLFFQISPHAFSKHVNLVAKEGNLYIILSENYKEDILDRLSEEELYDESNASLTLSSAQANVLAVCIFFALNLSQNWTDLNFLGIDDPFQNMDDINVFSFIDTLSSLQRDNQIIISTHNNEFSSLLRSKSELPNNKISYINLKTYSKEGISYLTN